MPDENTPATHEPDLHEWRSRARAAEAVMHRVQQSLYDNHTALAWRLDTVRNLNFLLTGKREVPQAAVTPLQPEPDSADGALVSQVSYLATSPGFLTQQQVDAMLEDALARCHPPRDAAMENVRRRVRDMRSHTNNPDGRAVLDTVLQIIYSEQE